MQLMVWDKVYKHIVCAVFSFVFMWPVAYAQDTVSVQLKTNVGKDRIQLRWAVNSPSAWRYTNQYGVTVERYTLMRKGEALDTPEKILLTAQPLKPHPLNDWESVAQRNNQAAIIAQALYGSDFEISGGTKNVSQVIALSQEQEQRYAMSMIAAEMSYEAALFAGWGYEDLTAKQGERYLYRIIPVSPDTKKTIEIGTAYTGLDDYRELPRPLELTAVWGNKSVVVMWNSRLLEPYYNSYYLYRSDDGKIFNRTSQTPLMNVTDNDRIFYTDSITNGKTYYYCLTGLTPFDEEGPVSDTIQGQGVNRLVYNPHITQVLPNDSGRVEISWDFDERGNDYLSAFELRRGDTDKGPFLPVIPAIPPAGRKVVYEKPFPENYLVIAAISKEGDETVSFPFFLQMEDSIPPAVPQELEGIVDTTGVVRLKWIANTEPDLLGYRVYRGQTQGEELIPLTDIVIRDNVFTDSIDIYNLNAKVYYAVTALDKRYNQSALSETVELKKPDVIKPSPPFITRCEATDRGVLLEWVAGKEPVRSFDIFRTEKGNSEFHCIDVLLDTQVTTYLDSTAVSGTNYVYEIAAENYNFMMSDRSPARFVQAKGKDKALEIKRFRGERTEKGIALKWDYDIPAVRSVTIYRKEGESPLMLWKEVESWERETFDTMAQRGVSCEYLLVIKNSKGIPVSAPLKIN